MNTRSLCIFTGLLVCLSLAPPVRADFIGVTSQTVDFSSGYVNADGSTYSGPGASLINPQVSGAWSSFSTNFAVLRFYAHFNDPTDEMIFFGAADFPLAIQVITPSGQQFFEPVTDSLLPADLFDTLVNPNVAFDSWLTVGVADRAAAVNFNVFATPTIPITMLNGLNVATNRDGMFLIPEGSTPGSPNPASLPDAMGRVLFAQITVPSGTLFSFSGSLAYLDGGSALEIEQTFFFASIPAPGAAALLAIAGLIGSTRRKRAA